MIPYGRQEITQADIEAVVDVLRSDFLTQGPVVPRFERELARRCGAAHALAVNSATSALHIACLALGLGTGDILWTSPITFLASANCALYCGAQVDFVDIDPRTYNMSAQALEAKLEKAAREGRLPKVVVPVHLAGQACDMRAIHALSQRYGFRIIEDASHAIGGRYLGQPVGSCSFSDITVFSFHPVKIITTAEGGVALTNSPELARKLDLLRSHGMTRDPALMSHAPDGPWYYQQVALGFNYRMTELQAALGLSQLERLERYVSRRHELAAQYERELAGLPITLPWQHPDTYSAFHLYVVRLQRERIRASHKEVFEALREHGIGVNVHYIPVHTQPWYAAMGFRPGDYPEAERYYREAISLPMYPTLGEAELVRVCTALREAVCA
ncbi:UDP-4-amino-4,6-dideoxy-N-acetyl-beta-L-altrosamine transaminase [Ramlibacter sp. AN1133]|uniref:UDP-4-amino-4, 6-dideoxy-N-acetyl-beta-L-altrosamine transaminase n=1 Tax=Ramlibacter sp. AN1133 TaxID=3133429 RepID=UPI0030BA7D8B